MSATNPRPGHRLRYGSAGHKDAEAELFLADMMHSPDGLSERSAIRSFMRK